MKVAIVVQRYGNEVLGGAETHARKIAEHLQSDLNWEVEVLTTTALSYGTWSNHYPKGETFINGIKVRRFRTFFPRAIIFRFVNHAVLELLPELDEEEKLRFVIPWIEKVWYILQGPFSPSLIRYIKRSGSVYDALFYFTYLYYPTIEGIKHHSDRSFLIPEAHDEAAFYFRGTEKALFLAQGILANTPSEIRLIGSRCPPAMAKTSLAGMGIDLSMPAEGAPETKLEPLPRRYLLYLGRVGTSKKVHILCKYFLAYIEQSNDSETHLILAGGIDEGFKVPKHNRIRYLGFVSEDDKARLIANCLSFVNPSEFESLSIVVAEAITFMKPVMVNAHCEVLRDYSLFAKSVFPYYSESDFSRIFGDLVEKDWIDDLHNKQILQDSKAAIDKIFKWSSIMETYKCAVLNSKA